MQEPGMIAMLLLGAYEAGIEPAKVSLALGNASGDIERNDAIRHWLESVASGLEAMELERLRRESTC